MMRKGLFALALGAAMVAGVASAEAMPAASVDGASPAVILVAGGCGIGFHRGPYGGCRANGYGPGYGYGWRGGYWRGGWHRGWRRW